MMDITYGKNILYFIEELVISPTGIGDIYRYTKYSIWVFDNEKNVILHLKNRILIFISYNSLI